MAPYLTVGLLADLERRERAVAPQLTNELEAINKVLAKNGLEAHVEPYDTSLFEVKITSLQLHSLRRLAANLNFSGELPTPGNEENVDEDELIERYYEEAGESQGLLSRILAPQKRILRHFDHLIVHRDDDGFYLPIEFEKPIEFTSQVSGPGWVGSAIRLQAECEGLQKRLKDSDAHDSSGTIRFEQESAALKALLGACEHSLNHQAVLAIT